MIRLLGIRPQDRRPALLGFATLAGLMASHAMMETARDTLFLSRLPAEMLPWTYLGIAVVAVAAMRANRLLLRRFDKRRLLCLTAVTAAVVTAGLWSYVGTDSVASLYVVYVWAGLAATVVVVQFWLMMSELVTVTQAKRLFGPVAAGGLTGATLGSFLAERLVAEVEPRHLLLGSASVLLVTSLAPLAGGRVAKAAGGNRSPSPARDHVRLLRSQPYLRRMLLLVLVSTLALTGVDWVFKAVVAEHVAAEDLGTYFARFYLVVNALALVVQLALSGWLLSALGVSRALLVLPVLLMIGVAGVGAGSGLIVGAAFMSVLFLKGADGSLRHSIHRTSTEVLYVPLPTAVRERFKAIIDVVGQRGGQALASLAILGAVFLGAGPSHVAMAVGLLVVLWVAVAVDIKAHYLELFRGNLREGAIDTRVQVSDLDLHTLEALVAALNSDEDHEVLAALELFEQHDRVRLVPALLLYHPSGLVVQRTLELLTRSGRDDFLSVARRLLSRDDDEVRSAALRAITTVKPDEELLVTFLEDPAPMMRATALVGMAATEIGDREQVERSLACYAGEEVPEVRRALARAIRLQRDTRFVPTLLAMADAPVLDVRREVAEAMAAVPDERFLPALTEMLGHGELRIRAREALLPLGAPALEHLERALSDTDLPRTVRRHLPRSIHRFEPVEASNILLRRLPDEPDEAVRYKILRALGRLRTDHPSLKLDKRVIRRATQRTLERAIQMLAWRLETEAAHERDRALVTRGGVLLVGILSEKERTARERLFRLLGLLNRHEDFELLYDALRRRDKRAQAGSRELLEYAVPAPFRAAVLALVDDDDDRARLDRAAAALGISSAPPAYEERLVEMLDDPSEAVRSIAAYHIGELGLTELVDELRTAQPETGLVRDVIDRALEMLASPSSTKDPHAA